MTVHIDREKIIGVVRAALSEIVNIDRFPVFWDLDDGEFYGREPGKLGAFLQLSTNGSRTMGGDDGYYRKGDPADPGDATFVTITETPRTFTLTIRCESDVADAQDHAQEIVEHVRHRLEEREVYIDMMLDARVSVQSSSAISEVPALWSGRSVSGAACDLTCMVVTVEEDASEVQQDGKTSGGGDYFNAVDRIEKVPES